LRNTHRHVRRSAAQVDDLPQMARELRREVIRVPLIGIGEVGARVGIGLRGTVHDLWLQYPVHNGFNS
jgi:hypothetical protein